MMRWNSTKTYTEDDMIRMQQEAVSRVREFQTRARQSIPFYDVPESAITPISSPMQEPPMPAPVGQPQSQPQPQPQPESVRERTSAQEMADVPLIPPEMEYFQPGLMWQDHMTRPQDLIYPGPMPEPMLGASTYPLPQPVPMQPGPESPAPEAPPQPVSIVEDPIRGIFERFNIDPEVGLIIALIFLLHNENADNLLLLALGYLLL